MPGSSHIERIRRLRRDLNACLDEKDWLQIPVEFGPRCVLTHALLMLDRYLALQKKKRRR